MAESVKTSLPTVNVRDRASVEVSGDQASSEKQNDEELEAKNVLSNDE